MRNISDQINYQINSNLLTVGSLVCSPSLDCMQVDCDASDGTLSIILSCSPVGVILKSVNTSTSPPETESGVFSESGTFQDYYQVTVNQWTSAGFGFALRIHTEDDYFTFDLPLVNRAFIPTASCGIVPTSIPITVPGHSDASPSTASPSPTSTDDPSAASSSTASTGTTGTNEPTDVPTHGDVSKPSASPEPSTNAPAVPHVTGTTCDAMESLAQQMSNTFTCRREDCGSITCQVNGVTLNFYISCSPVGMKLQTLSNSRVQEETLFTQSGSFDDYLNVTVRNYSNKFLGFALSLFINETDFYLEIPVANYTVIPLDFCSDENGDDQNLNGKVFLAL